jgi:hypothetical protein
MTVKVKWSPLIQAGICFAEKVTAPNQTFTTALGNEELNREEPEMANAQLSNPYQSYLDPGLFNRDAPFSQDDVLGSWHVNTFEEWLGGLHISAPQFSAQIAAPAQI